MDEGIEEGMEMGRREGKRGRALTICTRRNDIMEEGLMKTEKGTKMRNQNLY